jgi:glycosyltransferase involved in cell wall biosynthesis
MKIALCKSHFAGPVSGADEILISYALALHQAGYEVQVVLLYRCAEHDQYYLRLRNAGVDVSFVVPRSVVFEVLQRFRNLLAGILFFIFLMPRAPELLRRIWQWIIRRMTRRHYRACLSFLQIARPDVLHVFTPDDGAALLISAGHELGIPVLYHEMGTPHHLPMLEDYYRRLETVLPLCTEVVALSPRLAAEWSVRFPFLSSISVLPLIVEPPHPFNLTSESPTYLEEAIFGFAGRLEEGKGPLVLVDALASVNREGPLAVARVAGVGPQLLQVKARVRELGLRTAFEFVGHFSEPLGRTAFMNSLDVFVLPSFAEGTPKSIIEAMAHGLPVIATTVGGIPDILDGESGILVPPGDAAALADAMLLLTNDHARRMAMGVAAKQRYEKFFSQTAVLPLMLQTYGRITRNGHEFAKDISEDRHPWSNLKSLTAQKTIPGRSRKGTPRQSALVQ